MFRINSSIMVKAFAATAALTVVLATGCSAGNSSKVSLREPDPAAALVMNEPGLGAADSLGHVVFVEEGYRYAQANSVFQMASAENPNLKLSGITYESPSREIPTQVIVSADQLRREMLASGQITAPTSTVTGVDTNLND